MVAGLLCFLFFIMRRELLRSPQPPTLLLLQGPFPFTTSQISVPRGAADAKGAAGADGTKRPPPPPSRPLTAFFDSMQRCVDLPLHRTVFRKSKESERRPQETFARVVFPRASSSPRPPCRRPCSPSAGPSERSSPAPPAAAGGTPPPPRPPSPPTSEGPRRGPPSSASPSSSGGASRPLSSSTATWATRTSTAASSSTCPPTASPPSRPRTPASSSGGSATPTASSAATRSWCADESERRAALLGGLVGSQG